MNSKIGNLTQLAPQIWGSAASPKQPNLNKLGDAGGLKGADVQCSQNPIFEFIWVCLLIFSISSLMATPPQQIPPALYSAFSMNGTIPVAYYYLDHSSPETPFYAKEQVDFFIEQIKRKETFYYGDTDRWLYEALEAFPIKGKSVAIIGSVSPWYESIVLAYGGFPTTIEYNPIETDDPRLRILSVEEYRKHPLSFDIILSISSTEHDGLGRYGDRVNPIADIEFMHYARTVMLKQDGLLFLAVPYGQDCLVWNAHRIYGPLRFPLLTLGWHPLASFGLNEPPTPLQLGYPGFQPVFVLTPIL